MIAVSERAIKELKKVVEEEGDVYVRVAIKGGGCSGYQHSLTLEEGESSERDLVYEVSGMKIVIDNRSAMYLTGTKLDFVEDLNNHGFKFSNPNAKTTCGCGQSFNLGYKQLP